MGWCRWRGMRSITEASSVSTIYCPEDWREMARDKKGLKDSLADRGIDAGRLAA